MRTSEKNGAAAEPGGSDATAGRVTVSAERGGRIARRRTARAIDLPTASIRRRRTAAVYAFPLADPVYCVIWIVPANPCPIPHSMSQTKTWAPTWAAVGRIV